MTTTVFMMNVCDFSVMAKQKFHLLCIIAFIIITLPTSILHLAAKRVNWLGGIIWLMCEEVLSLTSNIGTYIYFYKCTWLWNRNIEAFRIAIKNKK